MEKLSHTECTDMVSPQYDSSYVGQDQSYLKMLSHTGCIDCHFEDYQAGCLNQLKKCFSEATFLAAALTLESRGQHAGAPAEAREYLTICLSKCKTVIYVARESQMLTRRIQFSLFSCRRQQRSLQNPGATCWSASGGKGVPDQLPSKCKPVIYVARESQMSTNRIESNLFSY